MTAGTFEVGETVKGRVGVRGLGSTPKFSPTISFRVNQSNHRRGDYNSQTKFIRTIHMFPVVLFLPTIHLHPPLLM